jgi:hypothetical protein
VICHCPRYAVQSRDWAPLRDGLDDRLEERGGFLRRKDWVWSGLPLTEKGERDRNDRYYACALCGGRWRVGRRSVFDEDFVRWEGVDGRPELDAHYRLPEPPLPDCACAAWAASPFEDPRARQAEGLLRVARAHWTDTEQRFVEWFVACGHGHRWKVTHDARAEPRVFHWQAGSVVDDHWYLERLPWSQATLDRVLAEVAGPPAGALEDCPLCRAIPPSAYRLVTGGEVNCDSIPPEAARLVEVLKLEYRDGLRVQQCPECRRLYVASHTYEYLVGGSEDEDSLERIEAAEVRERVQAYLSHFTEVRSVYKDGATWVISFSEA